MKPDIKPGAFIKWRANWADVFVLANVGGTRAVHEGDLLYGIVIKIVAYGDGRSYSTYSYKHGKIVTVMDTEIIANNV